MSIYQLQKHYNIKIDSRKCGEGKTTQTLNKEIKKCLGNNKPFMIAAPTIILQTQHDTMIDKIGSRSAVVINSENAKNVIKAITESGIDQDNMLITHSALLKCTEFANMKNYTVMIDESPTGFILSQKLYRDSVDDNIRWENYYEYVNTIGNYTQFKCVKSPWEMRSQAFINLTHPDWQYYMLSDNWESLTSDSVTDEEVKNIMVYCVNPLSILTKCSTALITAANFKNTEMSAIMDMQNIQYTIPNELQFEKHDKARNGKKINIVVHYADFAHLDNDSRKGEWGTGKRNNQKESSDGYLKQFESYTKKVVCNNKLLYLNNNDTKKEENLKWKLGDNQIELTHVCHGINNDEWQDCYNIALLASLNLRADERKFWVDVVLGGSQEDRFFHITCVSKVYQQIMRCAIRSDNFNGDDVNVFVMDYRIANGLKDYFENITLIPVQMGECKAVVANKLKVHINKSNAAIKREEAKKDEIKLISKLLELAALDENTGSNGTNARQKKLRLKKFIKTNKEEYSSLKLNTHQQSILSKVLLS